MIIRDHDISMPSQFARFMWSDNLGWHRQGKAGNNGVAKGVGMRLAGGAYLGKLRKYGYVSVLNLDNEQKYILTDLGEATLLPDE